MTFSFFNLFFISSTNFEVKLIIKIIKSIIKNIIYIIFYIFICCNYKYYLKLIFKYEFFHKKKTIKGLKISESL